MLRLDEFVQRSRNRTFGSMPVIFTAIRPRGVTHSELSFGGLDPSATPGRKYGAKSSGVLGRAYFDNFNSNRGDKNTTTSPGLGVFGGELFLFEAETHISLYPLFVTTFAKRFMKLVGEPSGAITSMRAPRANSHWQPMNSGLGPPS